jgi:hypothetical protein
MEHMVDMRGLVAPGERRRRRGEVQPVSCSLSAPEPVAGVRRGGEPRITWGRRYREVNPTKCDDFGRESRLQNLEHGHLGGDPAQ